MPSHLETARTTAATATTRRRAPRPNWKGRTTGGASGVCCMEVVQINASYHMGNRIQQARLFRRAEKAGRFHTETPVIHPSTHAHEGRSASNYVNVESDFPNMLGTFPLSCDDLFDEQDNPLRNLVRGISSQRRPGNFVRLRRIATEQERQRQVCPQSRIIW